MKEEGSLDGPDSHSPAGDVFYVSIGEQPDAETKVYADENLRVLWNHDDRISIFNRRAYNREYSFQGEDGTNAGTISPEGTDGEGDPLSLVYAVYPYQDSTSVSSNGIISFTLPEIQTYHENSFGIGANLMVSAAEGSKLKFKNVGGYLALKLYGNNVSVSSVIVRGNNNELLAGLSEIEMTEGGPEISLDAESASKQVRLYCNDPVELGSSSNAEECTVFWFVLPPVEFSQGFNITVTTPDGGVFKKSTSKPTSVLRSTITRFAPLEVTPTASGNDIKINEISSTRPTATNPERKYTAEFDSETSTYTILLPTVTDFSNMVLDYLFTGDKLLANGKEVVSGVTPVDATGDGAKLMVCRGDAEKRFTLKVRNTGLPVVRIETPGHTQDEITRDTWLEDAVIRIDNPDGSLDCEVTTGIKGRGNSTWAYNKKPYSLKFTGKQQVLGMPAHKRWVLLANWTDRTLLRNDAAFWLSRQAGMPYTVRGQFVELEFNGIHRGNYYLCEQIKIGKNRVNIKEMDDFETDPFKITGGYLMEIDTYYDEPKKFRSQYFRLPYQFKQPDEDGLSEAAFKYMKGFINDLEYLLMDSQRVLNHEYEEYLDVDSAIWFLLLNELANNSDFYNQYPSAGPHSMYLYKDRDSADGKVGKLFTGPIWDFDYHVFVPKYSNQWVGAANRDYYYNFLYQDSKFTSRMQELWDSKKDEFLKLTDYIDEMADRIRLSEEFNHEMWPIDRDQNGDAQMTFDEAIERIKEGFTKKLTWMDYMLPLLHYMPR